jgi:CRISPR system Cascade subunit CasD
MSTLLLRLAGPVQTWGGYRARVKYVDTFPVPTKTGVAGLLGAGLGVRDFTSLLDEFELDVRVDRTNPAVEDLQTVTGPKPHEEAGALRAERVRTVSNKGLAASKIPTGTSQAGFDKHVLIPHAEFLTAVTPRDPGTAVEWLAQMRRPVWMQCLGRRPNAPTYPMLLGVAGGSAPDVFEQVPRVVAPHGPYADLSEGPVRCYRLEAEVRSLPEPYLAAPPVVATREEYLTWVSQNLTR